jgi:hypothetical protein
VTKMKKLKVTVVVMAALLALYGLDLLSVLAGVPSRPRYSTVTINRFYYINEKFNKFSYEPISSVDEQCVNAMFPQFGARPCWYVQRHTSQTIDVN